MKVVKYLNKDKNIVELVDITKPGYNPAEHNNITFKEAMDEFHVIDADNKVGALFMYHIISQEKKKNLEGSLGVNQEVHGYTLKSRFFHSILKQFLTGCAAWGLKPLSISKDFCPSKNGWFDCFFFLFFFFFFFFFAKQDS